MSKLWVFSSAGTDDFSVYVHANVEDVRLDIFSTDGKPKDWIYRPRIEVFVDKKRKVQKPQADIGQFTVGTIILNEKAYAALGTFLRKFGQLLEVDCYGQVRYFYNITNLIPVIDFEASDKIETIVLRPAFQQDKIPADAQIFKDPLMAGTRMFVTQAAKDVLEKIIEEKGLTGLFFYNADVKYYRRTH